jgi:hypothetical protein
MKGTSDYRMTAKTPPSMDMSQPPKSAAPDGSLGTPQPINLEVDSAYRIVQTPTDFALYRGDLLMGAFPTLADAKAAQMIAEAH